MMKWLVELVHRTWSSAAYRIAFTYSAALAVAIVGLGALVLLAADAQLRADQDAALRTEATGLARDVTGRSRAAIVAEIGAREAGRATNVFGYALFAEDGRRIGGALVTTRPKLGLQDIRFVDPVDGPDGARALALDLGGARLVVAAASEPVERIDQMILLLFTGALVVVGVGSAIGASLFGAYLRRRIERISGTARAIVAGEFGSRVPVGGRGDEFDALAVALNVMLDRIASLLDNVRQVSSDVAHDLRTPLTRLRNLLAEGLADPHPPRTVIERAIAQSDALLALFAAILRISEVESGALADRFAVIDLSALITELCDSWSPAIADGGRCLGCRICPGVLVLGDRELLAQAVINLLENAQSHTRPGSSIALTLSRSGDAGEIAVADDGPGVAAADRPRLTQRFVRLDPSRTSTGHGLGLNLVAAITALHRASLHIDDNRPGLRVSIVIAVADVPIC